MKLVLFGVARALRVFPAETRLTVYCRFSVSLLGDMWLQVEGQKLMTLGAKFELCSKSEPFVIYFETFLFEI